MSEAILPSSQSIWSARASSASRVVLPLLAAGVFYAASISPDRISTLILIAIACVLLFGWASRLAVFSNSVSGQTDPLESAKAFCENDLLATLISNDAGEVIWFNSASSNLMTQSNLQTISIKGFLEPHLPNVAGIVRRMSKQVDLEGACKERLVGQSGRVDIHVQRFGQHQLWRIDLKLPSKSDEQNETAMLTIGRKGAILYMNGAAKDLIGERVKGLDRLFFNGMPLSGQVQSLSTSNGTIKVHVKTQQLQADRSHMFLSPVKAGADGGDYVLKDLPIPILHLRPNGEIEQANTEALTLLGYSDLIGSCLTDIFDSHGLLIDDWIDKATSANSIIDAEFLRVRGAKKETVVQVALKRIGNDADSRLVAILSDATKLKSLEAQFVQSQKMQAIGQLAGGVAHDFNNLLTAISGHCDLMLLRHDPGDQDYADLMQIYQNSNRAAGLVSQLLAFSRKQTMQLEHLDLRDTLSDLTHLLNRLVGETVILTLTHDPVLKPVRADKRQLEQVIMNLVVNARDAMPSGGEITIQTENTTLSVPLRRDRVTVPTGDYIVVRVRDVGTGIDADALEKIFEPFYTTKRTGEGTGLGLSTAYGIVKQTGGFIFADSELGQGTCFSLLFPASNDQATKIVSKTETLPRQSKTMCSGVVLLVEDEAPVRAFASRALGMCGFEVIEAECAEMALDMLQDKTLKVDVFVTDVIMPGMDGPTWARKAMVDRPDVKVIFVSGYAEGAFQGENKQLPESVFLPKPFSLAELTSTVQSQLTS